MLKTVTNSPIKSGNQTIVDGNLVIATSGNGIDFSASSQSPFATSELLNDYEEGTWTPGFAFSGGTTGITYSVQLGYYTKVGNIVHASCIVDLSSKGSSSGDVTITGLPFAVANDTAAYAAASLRFHDIAYVGQMVSLCYPNTTSMSIEQVVETGGRSNLNNLNFVDYSGLVLQLTYRAQ